MTQLNASSLFEERKGHKFQEFKWNSISANQRHHLFSTSTSNPIKFNSKNSDKELLNALIDGKLAAHSLESIVDAKRAVKLRRNFLEQSSPKIALGISDLPIEEFDYEKIKGVNCENVIGYVQVPVGIVGNLIVDKENYYVPLATTEGALIASTSRGCKGKY